jgi:tetratricopeptide (TPR) repeat protein
MKLTQGISVLTIGFFMLSCSKFTTDTAVEEIIPSIDEMSSVWSSTDTIDFMPSLRNFRAQGVINRDMTSISWFNSPPYSMGYHSGTLKINGKIIRAEMTRWNAYGAERKANHSGIEIYSDTRMVFEENGILWKIIMRNTTDEDQTIQLSQDVVGFLGKYNTQWEWWYPLPSVRGNETALFEKDFLLRFKENLYEKEKIRDNLGLAPGNWPTDLEILSSELYMTKLVKNAVIIEDHNSPVKCAFQFGRKPQSVQLFNSGATVDWTINIPAGESFQHTFTMVYGDSEVTLIDKGSLWMKAFDNTFNSIKEKWNDKWIQIFTPNNNFLSGNVPVLETEDQRAKRVYYISVMTMLYLMNTNLPAMERVVLTGGPGWGGSIMFFWDTTSWRTIGAVSDPEMMLENLKGWLTLDINKIYGRDYLSGNGIGYRYVANYWAIFQMLHEYLVVSGDYALLDEIINGKTIMTHLHEMAYNWQNLSREGEEGYEGDLYKLADFGGDKNALLEAVPNYKHIVVSFNAGYVGMMRRLSEIYEALGNKEKSEKVKTDAAEMAQRVLQLYTGDGVWYGLFPNNEKREIRHILDFHFVGRYMGDDLTPEIKEEMIQFVESELMTESWMRAQSKDDLDADHSDRPDHGPLGSYDGWPLNTMEAFYHMGYPEKAMDFYRAIYPVTLEGTWAQSHELWGDNKYNKNARVRIARRGLSVRDAASGIGYANLMLREFFGFAPKFMNDSPLDKPQMARSIQGKMHHINYQGNFYTIVSNENGLQLIKEKIK